MLSNIANLRAGESPRSRDGCASVVQLTLAPEAVFRWHLAVIALLVLLGSMVGLVAAFWGYQSQFGLRPLFDLNGEHNVPAMLSSVAILLAAALLACIAAQEYQRRAPLRRYWMALCLGFAYLALDEAAAVHEKFNRPIRILFDSPDFAAAWVVVGVGGALLVGLLFVPFLLRLRRGTAVEFMLAGGVYLLGALGVESVGGPALAPPTSFLFHATIAVEEALEMAGIALFVRTLLRELQDRGVQLRLAFA